MNENQAARALPEYRSHKHVWALKLRDVNPGGSLLTPEDARYAPFHVAPEYFEKHSPKPGGYFVLYQDGYQSFSPEKAFEEGYSEV